MKFDNYCDSSEVEEKTNFRLRKCLRRETPRRVDLRITLKVKIFARVERKKKIHSRARFRVHQAILPNGRVMLLNVRE